ncbi:TetR/AcrR family transcriptional regulator [Sphingomonas sp. MG17]|uniref:TetR/AcrR family transcriptional regulator n=1 Tax=Sphingomonas tagetis TaxID=2949092 RepID=A0A9X2HV80_9SPHN|nr:TetR/AcrR family transcriptional regulator [Sphingomonas tagetis]MCP3732600.1 TetR/AcrR family transcriptional regulator [Sphingomonas tagetis]
MRLIECAPKVVAKEGFEGASIDKITEAAGYSKGAFYSNFGTKEEFFLELLERHAGQDVVEIRKLLSGVTRPAEIIDRMSNWAAEKSADPTWGLLPLELFRKARRDATFTTRHATLFREQWRGVGELLLPIAPRWKDPQPELLGAIVLELTYGAASSFSTGEGPAVRDLVRLTLDLLQRAYGEAD